MNISETIKGIVFEKWSGAPLPQALVSQVWTIAEDSFPPEEREPCKDFLQPIENGRSILYLACLGDKVAGFTKLTRLGQSLIYLMEYLAVNEKFRNRGIGSQILHFIREDLQHQPTAGILLEVEPPPSAAGSHRQLRDRRIRFYQRHGAARILDHDAYRMPSTIDEGSLWMHLMWLPVRDGCLPPAHLSLEGLFKLIFLEIYPGPQNKQLLGKILHDIEKNDGLIRLEGAYEIEKRIVINNKNKSKH